MAVRANESTFDTEVLKSDIPVLVEFYSDSCVPCKMMSPILGDLEDDYENRLKIVKVNINFAGNLTERYQIMTSPVLVFFKNGEEVNRVRGVKKKSELEEIIKSI